MLRTHKSGIKKYRNGAVDRVVAPAMRDGRPERGRDRALDADGIAEVGGYINDGAAHGCSWSIALLPPCTCTAMRGIRGASRYHAKVVDLRA